MGRPHKIKLQSNYDIVSKGGIVLPKQNAGYLYVNPSFTPQKYRPVYYQLNDIKKAVSAYDRRDQMRLARSLYCRLPDLGNAINSKASWAVGPNSFAPIFTGQDQEWGNQVETWLNDNFYNNCCIAGNNYDFRTILYTTSISLDVDGDSIIVYTKDRSGYPLIQLIPSHRVGCRNGEEIVKDGKYEGYNIYDGIIYNDNGRPIAIRILGDKVEDDQDISIRNCQLLFEPEFCDNIRGISRVARSIRDFLDLDDTDENIKIGVKLAQSLGIIINNQSGEVETTDNIVGVTEDTTVATTTTTNNQNPIETFDQGWVQYFKAGSQESISELKSERPSPNTEAFIQRIQRRALASVGWGSDLLDPSKIGGASVRLIQDLTRKTISQRQTTLERRAKSIILYAVSSAMELGLIPQNNGDWYKWTFTKGGQICVDNGNEAQADREGLKLGTTSLSIISSKCGIDWQDLRKQQKKEVLDLITKAKEISNETGLDINTTLSLMQQRTPNQSPISNNTTDNNGNNTDNNNSRTDSNNLTNK